ncbi:MAG: hypothetical protein ACRDRJ_00465 [Streptosporangiaceae bacterium]
MTAEAARLREGEKGEQDAARVSLRVDEVTVALQGLGQAVGAIDRLHAVSGTRTVDLSGLDEGRVTFAGRAKAGLPSNQVFTAAKQKINGVISRLNEQLGSAWAQWTSEQMAGLPLIRIPLLDADEQKTARERRDELLRLAKIVVPSSADVGTFQSTAGLLRDTLSEVAPPPPEILALLQRLGERPPMTLDQLTDYDIGLLRQAGIADQIEVRRRGM